MKSRPFRPLGAQEAIEAIAAYGSARGLSLLDGDGSAPHGGRTYIGLDPIEIVEAWTEAEARTLLKALSEGKRGAEEAFPREIGFFAFDAFDADDARRESGLPRARFARYQALLEIDELNHQTRLIGEDEGALDGLEAAVDGALEAHGAGERFMRDAAASVLSEDLEEEAPELHLRAIKEAIERIERGELLQVNLARPYRARYEGDPLSFYLAMREVSPVPFGFFQAFDGKAILGRSMESFLSFDAESRLLTSSPIKGTRASAADEAETRDASLGDDPRERKEHGLVLDHALSELREASGDRAARASSPYFIERFSVLEHLISHIEARVPHGRSLGEILPALFPPLSVLGIPREEARRLIDRLERGPRGVYCGAYGYFSARGDAQLAVAIRTAFFDGERLHYHAGGGLIAEADPATELEETRLKARAFVDAFHRLRG